MNILFLSTYPISKPQHGGQLRVRNIVDQYVKEGNKVKVIGVLGSNSYSSEIGFINFPGEECLATILPNTFLMEDYLIGRLFSNNQNYYDQLASLVPFRPDVVHVEQPWLYEFAEKFVARSAPLARIIYSSHNIEWQLKQEIISSYFDQSTAEHCGQLVKAVELAAIKGADEVICVSESDALWIGAQSNKNVVLAPNGVKSWDVTDQGRAEAKKITGNYRYALYCASAHPPNMTGFFQMFGGGFGSLKPDEKIVIAGSAGWAIAADKRVHKSAKLAEKVLVAGVVNQPCLDALLDGANCIVLPLTQGGGTNLKTAEALWSRKHIVATTIAMRGFEHFIDAQGVQLADSPDLFKRALRLGMGSKNLTLSDAEINERRSVLWEYCLAPLKALINNEKSKT